MIGTRVLLTRSELLWFIMQKKTITQIVYNSQSVSVSGMGLGKSYTGLHRANLRSVQLDGYWSKDKEWAREVIFFKGMVDDITLHHYGACDIYREFGDVVYITVPATAICSTQMMALTPCTANCVTT